MEDAKVLLRMAERRLSEAHAPAGGLFAFPPSAEGAFNFAASPLHTFGFQGGGLTPRGASRLGAAGGLLVVSVRAESPAAAGGLKAGDVVETVNGQKFTRDQLSRSLLGPAPVTLGVVRGGQRQTLTFALAPDPKPWNWRTPSLNTQDHALNTTRPPPPNQIPPAGAPLCALRVLCVETSCPPFGFPNRPASVLLLSHRSSN